MAVFVNGNVGFPSSRQLLAGAAKYFTFTNPTIGTPVVGALKTAWSATANGMFVISNNNPASSGINLYLDYYQLRLRSTAPTGTLVANFEVYNETGIVAGTTAVSTATPVQVNTGSGTSQTTGAVVQVFAAGAITIPAAVGTRRLQATGSLVTGVCVDGDVYTINFGQDGPSPQSAGLTAARATAPAQLTASLPPIIVAPQTTSWLNMWWLTAAANTPSWEFGGGYSEL